jgi:hypothetical protein
MTDPLRDPDQAVMADIKSKEKIAEAMRVFKLSFSQLSDLVLVFKARAVDAINSGEFKTAYKPKDRIPPREFKGSDNPLDRSTISRTTEVEDVPPLEFLDEDPLNPSGEKVSGYGRHGGNLRDKAFNYLLKRASEYGRAIAGRPRKQHLRGGAGKDFDYDEYSKLFSDAQARFKRTGKREPMIDQKIEQLERLPEGTAGRGDALYALRNGKKLSATGAKLVFDKPDAEFLTALRNAGIVIKSRVKRIIVEEEGLEEEGEPEEGREQQKEGSEEGEEGDVPFTDTQEVEGDRYEKLSPQEYREREQAERSADADEGEEEEKEEEDYVQPSTVKTGLSIQRPIGEVLSNLLVRLVQLIRRIDDHLVSNIKPHFNSLSSDQLDIIKKAYDFLNQAKIELATPIAGTDIFTALPYIASFTSEMIKTFYTEIDKLSLDLLVIIRSVGTNYPEVNPTHLFTGVVGANGVVQEGAEGGEEGGARGRSRPRKGATNFYGQPLGGQSTPSIWKGNERNCPTKYLL